jgi:3-deoxy-D-manno-octulosonic-acid transferase
VYLVYVLLTYLLAPVVIAMEGWKALWSPEYRGRLHQRLGFVKREPKPGAIWVHAVSVGEVQAAAGLIRGLQGRFPEATIIITTVTPTGAQRAKALFGESVRHCYLPYDLPGSVRRFLNRVRPSVAIILETEIWPTLYRVLGHRRIPLVLASARVSEKSVDRYRRMARLFKETLSHGLVIGAQSAADAERFKAIGAPAERIAITGNVKFDMRIPEAAVGAGRDWRAQHAPNRPVWVAGSTHEGEEDAALDAHTKIRARHPRALLILVPRHPQRFEAVRNLLRKANVRFAERGRGEDPGEREAVFLVDTLGELQAFYAASDVAYVGGSLVPVGGHNLLEPAVLGLPVLSGPYTQNAQEIADLLRQAGAVDIVGDANELAERVTSLFDDPENARATGVRGQAAAAGSRGAVDRLIAMIEPLINLRRDG